MSKLFSFCSALLAPAVFLVFVVTFTYDLETAGAANLVSGRYLSTEGTTVVLSLTIGNPSPANLIVEQYLSPGNRIAATSPPARKVDNDRSTVKWLFRNTRSGNITLSIQLKAPISGGASAMVRYRDPHGGSFTELRISP